MACETGILSGQQQQRWRQRERIGCRIRGAAQRWWHRQAGIQVSAALQLAGAAITHRPDRPTSVMILSILSIERFGGTFSTVQSRPTPVPTLADGIAPAASWTGGVAPAVSSIAGGVLEAHQRLQTLLRRHSRQRSAAA